MDKFIREIFNIKIRDWTLSLSILICIMLSNFYFNTIDFDTLTNFKDRTIGQNMLLGVNGGARTTTYLVLVILFSLCFVFLTVIFSFLFKKNENLFSSEICAFEKKAISTLSITAILTFLLGIYFPGTLVAGLGLKILLTGILLAFILLELKIYAHKDSRLSKLLENTDITITFTMLCVSILSYFRIIIERLPTKLLFWGGAFIILFMGCYIGYALLQRMIEMKSRSINTLDSAILLGGIPMLLLSFLAPIANEIQYTLSGRWALSAEKVSYWVSLLLMISGLTIFFLILNGVIRPKTTSKVIISNIYYPIIIATVAIFIYYTPTMNILQDQFEFHFGTHNLSVLQLFKFGKIPFIDNFPSRGASDLVEQMLYSLVNGYRFPLDSMLWEWIRWVCGAVLYYFLLKEVLSPAQSLLFLCFFWNPIIFSYVSGGYIAGFIVFPALVIKKLYEKQNFGLFCILWVSGILMFAWAFPPGIMTIVSSIFMVVLLILNAFLQKENWIKIARLALYSFVFVYGIVFSFFCTLVFLRGHSLSDLFVMIKSAFGPLGLAHTYPTMIRNMTPSVFFEYMVQPVVAVGIVLFTIINLKKKSTSNLLPFFAFLATANLVGFPRMLQRHSVLESFALYFPIYLIASLPIIYGWVKTQKYLIFILLSTSIAIVLMFGNGFQGEKLGLLTNVQQFHFIQWQDKQERVTYEISPDMEQIINFLDQKLQEGQTFYDFTDAPELFVLSKKEHLLYVTPSTMNLSDENQNVTNSYLQKAYDEEKLAYVIFKQGTGWDNLDNVPRELVSYRTAEFIYKHFHPAYMVGRYEVWAANFIESEPDKWPDIEFESLNLLNIESIQQNDVITTQIGRQGALQISAIDTDPYIINFLDLSEMKLLEKDYDIYCLQITYQAVLNGENDFKVFYAFEGEGFSENNSDFVELVNSNDGDDNVLVIRLNQTIHHSGQRLEALRFDLPDNSHVDIEQVEYKVTDSTYNEKLTTINQQFDLINLPYLWGTYDEKDAAHTTEVLQTIVNEEIQLIPNKQQTILINPLISKNNGNYIHFRIRSSDEANINFYYTNPGESYFSFDTVPSEQYEDYLVRVSTQWQWMSENVNKLVISSSRNLVISELYLREGD